MHLLFTNAGSEHARLTGWRATARASRALSLLTIAWLLLPYSHPCSAQTAPIVVDLASRSAWTFQPDAPGAHARVLSVPNGGWRLNGFPAASSGAYRRYVTVPRLAGGPQTTLLEFQAVNWEAVISVGPDPAHLSQVARHLSAWTPFHVDISSYVRPGSRVLVQVHVRDRNSFKDAQGRFTVPAGVAWTDRQGRGILRGVSLKVYPALYISDVFVRPNTASDSLSVDVTLANSSGRAQSGSLAAHLAAALPGASWRYPLLRASGPVQVRPHGATTVRLGPARWIAGRASWWWPNVPYRAGYRAQLHKLTLLLFEPGRVEAAQRKVVRFGFCTPGQAGNRYTFNGVTIRLRGDSLPESTIGTDAFARLPGFLPPSKGNPGWPGAVRNYLRLNYNVVRMHQVPCTPYMMDVCDELGLLVIPETAIRGSGKDAQDITQDPEAFTTHLRELVERDRNHPSVFKWSLENELNGAPESFIRQLYDTCRSADGDRPCSIDDNADYPSWPGFAVIQHYSQPAGTPDAVGGAPRADRPYGQGEYVWPFGNSASGALWFALETRSMRAHCNADLRPYTLIDVWPGVIPGLTPSNFPNPPSPPNSLEQGGRSFLNPANPWSSGFIRLIQRSFAPVAAFDLPYDAQEMRVTSSGGWPWRLLQAPAGQSFERDLTVFNDDLSGARLDLQVQSSTYSSSSGHVSLQPYRRSLSVPPGGSTRVSVPIALPSVAHNQLLVLHVIVSKDGEQRFSEMEQFVVTPPAPAGTAVAFAGRDPTTRGDWRGRYGGQAFYIAIAHGTAQLEPPEIRILRGTGLAPEQVRDTPLAQEQENQYMFQTWNHADPVQDRRVLLGGRGLTAREPSAFYAKPIPKFIPGTDRYYLAPIPLAFRVDIRDRETHRLSLYMLDYDRQKRHEEVDLYDVEGHLLDSRDVKDFSDGLYLRWSIRGRVIVLVKSLTQDPPVANAIFVDAASGPS